MTDSSSASSPEMPHRVHPPHRPLYHLKAITDAAGAGFRLSLALNAVGTESALRHEMASADIEIQVIAKKISEFSMMLKQVGKIVEESKTIASPAAVDTVTEIKNQSERDFDEIKSMIDMVQQRDEEGQFRGIEIARRVTWSFKKRKMQYLLGQLEYLKDSLAIMLQTLQLGKEIASAHEGRTRPPNQHEIEQERAEIQNMIIVQHWSMMELQKLYGLAEHESSTDVESPTNGSPPPSYDANPPGNHLTLTIGGSPESPKKEEPNSRALVTYQEQPLTVMRESCERVREREEEALGAPVPDIVDHLLDEWTQVGVSDYYNRRRLSNHRFDQRPPKPVATKTRHQAHVDSDESDTSEYDSDFERSENIGGYYIEGPRGATKKHVRFRASAEDEEDEEFARPRKTTKRHVLNTVDESSTSESEEDRPSLHPYPSNRRTSTSSNGSRVLGQAGSERQRRPYSRNSGEHPPSRPGSRGVSQGPPQITGLSGLGQPPTPGGRTAPVPMPVPMQVPMPNSNPSSWQGQPPNLRPPNRAGPPLPRLGSGGPPLSGYTGPSPGASPVTPHGSYFPPITRGIPPGQGPPAQPQPPLLSGYPPGTGPPHTSTRHSGPPPRQPPPPTQHNRHGHGHGHPHSSPGGGGTGTGTGTSTRRNGRASDRTGKKDASNTSKNVKKGLLGGGAIAGVMEILQGLDGL